MIENEFIPHKYLRIMKRIFTLALVFSLSFLVSQLSYGQELDSAKVVTQEQFIKMSKKSKKNLILDVRTPKEVAEGHIQGALFADFRSDEFLAELEKLDKKKTYLVYCYSGKRAEQASMQMKAAGFKKVYLLDGGMKAWEEDGQPVIK